ncbi:GRIP and coiled-coil domain-containing protein [Papilio machaon]|uniref:GRIP and coiled-coil domain-containing protein n=1 Tax=Papilio machaon TaxID=76193 RepID=UPI001E663E35|nr:GRIP and coiled-coil domain-containing protein [Papilio machaon]
MAQVEPMDIDDIDSDFDNKENSSHHSNVLPRTPCMEKGYEELDVSELNMKLRYSITPAASPMSKSLNDNESSTNTAVACENNNLTRSLNSTITMSEAVNCLKSLPLQVQTSDTVIDDRNLSVLRTIQPGSDNNNVTLGGANDNDENISLPSTSSSVTHTPEATTPTKEIPKHDGSSPIMRGLKSVLNMFRSSQSPIPPAETTFINMNQEYLNPNDSILKDNENVRCQTVVVSTPISNNKKASSESRKSSPLKESIVFNDDLEKDLQWKDETTIFFKDEKIPVHKLFPSQSLCYSKTSKNVTKTLKMDQSETKNITEEYMSMSNNASISQSGNIINAQLTSLQNEVSALESDGEFVDCEMTLNAESFNSMLSESKDNACEITKNKLIHENTKQVIDNIEDLLTDCEGNKSFVVQKPCEVNCESTAIHSNQILFLNHIINDQVESKTNIVDESHSTSEKALENNDNTNEMPASSNERIQSVKKNDLSAEEYINPTNITLCEDTVTICDSNNDYNEKIHPSEVPLPDDSNVDFMEIPNTIKDADEPKMCTIEQDLNQTAMCVDYSESVMTQESYCKNVQIEYEKKLDQDNKQETANSKPSDNVAMSTQEDCAKSQIIDSIDTQTETNDDQNEITNMQIESIKKDYKLPSKCVCDKETKTEQLELGEFNNEHSRTSMSENDDLSMNPYHSTSEHASLNNCSSLNITKNEKNAIEAQNSCKVGAINDHQVHVTNSTISMMYDFKENDKESNNFLNNEKINKTMDIGDETVLIESNINELSDKLTNFDNTYLNEPNNCAMDTTFNMDPKKETNFENASMHDAKKLVQNNVLKNTTINGESNKMYEDVQKDQNTQIETILNSVADKENVDINETSESEVLNQRDCFNNKEINILYAKDIVLPEENKTVNVSDILNPVKNEELLLENCLNVTNSLDYINKTYVTPDNPFNLPDQDTFVESIEEVVCQTEKTDSKSALNKHDVVGQERFAANISSHKKENDSIIDKNNISSVKSSDPKNVFNLPEMSDGFISRLKGAIATSSTPDAEDDSKYIFKVPSSNLTHLSQKCEGYTQDVDRKLCVDKNELDSSDVSTSSKASETTVHEVNTEDDDTVEASFFETEEFNDVDKKSDHEDMIDFSDIPTQKINNNAYKGEMFIDAEAFQFLLNQNKSNVVADSGRESLFLKFDPLFAKRMSTDAASVHKIQKGQSTPKKITKALSNIDFYRNVNETTESTLEANFEDATVLLSKPMMVVNPAVNSVFSPRNKSCTPPRANRRSHTFTSPAIAVIDRLLSLSGDNSALNLEMSMVDVRGRTNETDQVLTQLRELLAEKEINVDGLRSESKELSERLRTLESQVKMLETESEQRLRKVDDLNKCLVEKTKMNKGMAVVVEEYERTIASLTAEIEQDKKAHAEERLKLINERNEQNAHLASMTMSFNDLHSKYEKNKQIIMNCKDNEEKYKRSIKEFDESVIKIQNNYELLKQHATSNLNNKNDEFEKLNRTHEAEVLKYGAMIKRKEMDISSLKETLAQKIKANEELTAICDELLNKVA